MRSSSSGSTGSVQPIELSRAVTWPMLAKGSTRTTWNKQQKFDLLFDNCTFAHFSLHIFISYLDSQSDGTHWLQRIHKWAIDVMLHFSKSVHMKKQINLQWGKKVFSQPPIVQVLPLKKMREACNFHHMYTSTMRDKIRKKIQKITL